MHELLGQGKSERRTNLLEQFRGDAYGGHDLAHFDVEGFVGFGNLGVIGNLQGNGRRDAPCLVNFHESRFQHVVGRIVPVR